MGAEKGLLWLPFTLQCVPVTAGRSAKEQGPWSGLYLRGERTASSVLACMQGEQLCPAMLDCVVAACSQIGDSSRAFETFAAYGNVGLTPGAQAYNAVLQGCIYHGLIDSVPKVLDCAPCMLTLAAPMQLRC